MDCDHCTSATPHRATRTFDVPGHGLVRLCETHAGFWVARGRRPEGTVEIVRVELLSSDLGVVAEPAPSTTAAMDDDGGSAALIVPRSTYLRWESARSAWEDAQADMATELAKASVDALELTSDFTGRGSPSA